MDRELKDLAFVFNNSGDVVTIKTGELGGKTIKCRFDTNHLERSLDGMKIATSGPCITCLASDTVGLSSGDIVAFNGQDFEVSKVMRDATGLARVEFVENLDASGSVIHGNLRY